MIVGLIIRLAVYPLALIFTLGGLAVAASPVPGIGTRIAGLGMIFAGLLILPITRKFILNKFGISIGVVLAISILIATFIGFGVLSADASDVEITDIQTNVSESQVDTQATLTNPQSQGVLIDINTTLAIQSRNNTTSKIWQRSDLSIGKNTTKKSTILNMYVANGSGSQVNIEFRDTSGSVVRETTLNKSYWSAIQNGKYSITVDISRGENATYTPTNAGENTIRHPNIASINRGNNR